MLSLLYRILNSLQERTIANILSSSTPNPKEVCWFTLVHAGSRWFTLGLILKCVKFKVDFILYQLSWMPVRCPVKVFEHGINSKLGISREIINHCAMKTDELRHYNFADGLINHLDRALNSVFCKQTTVRDYPAQAVSEADLSATEKKHAAALMRVNHAGEISAQALYHGQSVTARDPKLKDELHHASLEESEHLNWCRQRLDELGEQPSRLDPLWYAGSFAIGVAAGVVGDRWNLGFLAATEHQVVRHLESHLQRLPQQDERSRAIVTQMKTDELGHAHLAESLGAADLPQVVKNMMQLSSKVMTTLAHKI